MNTLVLELAIRFDFDSDSNCISLVLFPFYESNLSTAEKSGTGVFKVPF